VLVEPVKRESRIVEIGYAPVLRPSPTLTSEERILLRGLVVGRTVRQIRKDLRMSAGTFFRAMREIREKTGAADDTSLIVWAKRQIQGADQRIDRHERHARLA
jgi:DNA-binding NarL/FixJ family response regulator